MLLFWLTIVGIAFVLGGPVIGLLVLALVLTLPSEDV
jgi:hypothetical protein